MANTLPAVDEAIYSVLSGAADVITLAGDRVYADVVPSGTAYPYARFYTGSSVASHQTPRPFFNEVYRVEAVDVDPTAAKTLIGAIAGALDGVTLAITGWANVRTEIERRNVLTGLEQGITIWRFIVDIRVQTSKE